MVRSTKKPEEVKAAELYRLSQVSGKMKWEKELAQCPELLALVPATIAGHHLPTAARPAALHIAMEQAVKLAYNAFRGNNQRRTVPASEALTGAALVGILTEGPDAYQDRRAQVGVKPPDRLGGRTDRINNIALDWYHSPVDVYTFRRTHQYNCLASFRDALIDTLRDEETLESIAFQLESESKLGRTATPELPPQSPTVRTLDQSLHGTYINRPDREAEIMNHLNNPDGQRNSTGEMSGLERLYVAREREEQQFADLVAAGHKVIVFVGLPGMGKTWLARAITKKLHPMKQPAPEIRIASGRPNLEDLRAAAQNMTTRYDTGQATSLAPIVSGNDAPQYVILDNLNSADELRALIPRNVHSIIVATCRSKGLAPPEECQFVRVPNMSKAESEATLERRLSGYTKHDIEYLANRLFRYPLVMRYACSLLRGQSVPIERFCHDFRAELNEVARHAQTEEGAALSVLFRRLVDQIKHQGTMAYELLVGLSFTHPGTVVRQVDLIAYLRAAFGREASIFASVRAIQCLVDSSVLESYPVRTDHYYAIHPFGQYVLRTEFQAEYVRVLRNAIALHYHTVAKLCETYPRRDGDPGRKREEEFVSLCPGWPFTREVLLDFRRRSIPDIDREVLGGYVNSAVPTVVGLMQIDGRRTWGMHQYWYDLVNGVDSVDAKSLIRRLSLAIQKIRDHFSSI